ncbi:hypothetical protein [Streptococcus suis]|nr:hypothetical protein [Streptococcus suis]HEL2364300.1 hypothetical protein [Streptococcus suis]HEL2674209.1 hypothetical protein [Streptococcus suis]
MKLFFGIFLVFLLDKFRKNDKIWVDDYIKGLVIMRLQLRLSQDAKIILEKEKLKRLENGVIATYGDIIEEICKNFRERLNEIDWLFVKNQPLYENVISSYTSLSPSALTLSDETVFVLDELTAILNSILNMKRTVYRSFTVRIILKAYALEQKEISISYID